MKFTTKERPEKKSKIPKYSGLFCREILRKSIVILLTLIPVFTIAAGRNPVDAENGYPINKENVQTREIQNTRDEMKVLKPYAAVNGIVVDSTNGEPLPGVTVRISGGAATQTDESGRFNIEANEGDVIEFSFVGYATRSVTVGPNVSFLNVSLGTKANVLDEVVAIGYGQMKKSDLSSSQVSISSAEINRTVNTSFDQALQGRAAGVYVTSSSSQPGAAPSVIVRGLGTLTQGSQPLYVIDGVQIRPDNVSQDPNNPTQGFSNVLSSINPNDIETINVLKGASATAIYGASGGNGVIIITTKSGKSGTLKIGLQTSFTIQDRPDRIAVMNLPEYAELRNQMSIARVMSTSPEFADPSVLGPGTDWQKELFKRTLLQNHQFSISGGSQNTTFYLSGEYFNQEGIVSGSGFDRYAVRINVDNHTKKWLNIGTHTNLGYTSEKVGVTNEGLIHMVLQQNPSVPVKNPDGTWGGPDGTQFQYTNPVMLSEIYDDYNKSFSIIGNVYADITPIKGLTIHNAINTSIRYFNYYSFHPGYEAGGFVVPPTAATSERDATNNFWWGVTNTVSYHFDLNQKHDFTVMAGHEAQKWTYESLSGWRQNYISDINQELSGGDASVISNVRNNSGKSAGSQESYFGRLNYMFNNKYIFQGTVRADGNSNFGPSNRWGYFPSASVAWRISQENFAKSWTSVDDLKLRLEYGESGNAAGGGIYSELQAVPTPWGVGYLSVKFPNPNLKWETDKTLNVGFDLHMFKNRLELIADAYIKKSTDLITVNTYPFAYGGDIAYSPGYIQWPTVNAGSIRNKGFDISINTVNIEQPFEWTTGLNFSLDRNKITSLLNVINPTWNQTQVQFVSKVGQPASMITGYIAEGLFQNSEDVLNHAIQTANGVMTLDPDGSWPGDIKFKDLNQDGVIDEKDREIIGNPWPKFTFGFNNSFSYKNFTLNLFFQGVYGNDLVNFPRYTQEIPGNSGTYSNYYKSVNNFARPTSIEAADAHDVSLENPGYSIPRLVAGDPNGNNRMSQWFVEDGSYLRLKNVSISYDFPKEWISHLLMTGLRASFNVQNAFTITKYKGYDPEVGMVNYGGTIMNGVDTGRFPSVRMYTFSLAVDF